MASLLGRGTGTMISRDSAEVISAWASWYFFMASESLRASGVSYALRRTSLCYLGEYVFSCWA